MLAEQTMAEKIRDAVDAVDADASAGTKRGSHTMQTRRVAAALRALGLKRSEFRARVSITKQQGVRYVVREPVGIGDIVEVHAAVSGVVRERVVDFGRQGYAGPLKRAKVVR